MFKNKKEFYFMVPENLELDEFLAINPPEFRFKTDNFAYILDLMYKIPARNKAIKENKKYRAKVPINAQILQKTIRDYDKYLQYLIKNKILETDNNFTKGEKSRYYWFTNKYKRKSKKWPVIDYILRKRIKKEQFDIKKVKYYRHLSKWFDDNLVIDYYEAMNYTTSIYEDTIKTGKGKIIEKAMASYISTTTSIDLFHNHEYYFYQDETGRRLHTNFTNMKSEIRNFIKYSDKTLAGADIKNSQPYFTLQFLNPEFYNASANTLLSFRNLTLNESPTSKLYITHTNINQIYHTLVKSLKYTDLQQVNDVQKYEHLVCSGTIYEFLIKRMKEVYNIEIKDRKTAKRYIFLILYADDNTLQYSLVNKIRNLFAFEFPTINRIFQLIKANHHEALAILLQRIESKFVLDIVTPEFAKLQPKVPIYTIHDSIITHAAYVDVLTKLIQSKAFNLLGTIPSVKPEYWTPANIT